jgi:hypothetical protein
VTYIDPYDPREEKAAIQRRAKREHLAALTEEEDWQWLMEDIRGRRIVRRLLETTGVYRTSFTGNSETFFREGSRNVGLQILNLVMSHAPSQHLPMMTETQSSD